MTENKGLISASKTEHSADSSTIVGLDTAPLIYFMEENPTYLDMTDAFFEAMFQGEFRVVTSVVTIPEVLVYPLRQGNTT